MHSAAHMSTHAAAHIRLWMLIVAQLDADQPGYTTKELAGLLGIKPHSMAVWCRLLFPRGDDEGRCVHWLNFEEMLLLVRRVCVEGRQLPDQDALHARLLRDGTITPRFPADNPAVQHAEVLLARQRARLLQGH